MATFLDDVRAIVGDANVLESGDPVLQELHSDPFAFDDAHAGPPVGVILPGSAEEVSAVVRAAAEAGESVWAVSRGRNLGYGGPNPASSASYLLDLSRMDHIVEVNVESGFAVVEPGVSFFDLYDHLRQMDAPLRMSVPDLGGGSLIGNALERGIGYSAYGQHADHLVGLEVVLPTGEIVRTGMGAVQGGATAHLYRGGYGPSVDGLFLQSNLGIVVRAGIWLAPRTEVVAVGVVTQAQPTGLAALVDAIRPLQLDGTIDGVVWVRNALAVASGTAPRASVFTGDGPVPDEVIAELGARQGSGAWAARFGLYGPQVIVAAKASVIAAALAVVPGAQFQVTSYAGDVDEADVHPDDRPILGIPSSALMQLAAWRGGTPGRTDFSLVTPTVGRTVQPLVDLVRFVVEKSGFDHVATLAMFGRHSILAAVLSFDASDDADRARVRALLSELVTVSAAAGYAPYRAHTALMDEVADVYGADDSALRAFVTALKDALDPAGVLSPGKQGIWPTSRPAP